MNTDTPGPDEQGRPPVDQPPAASEAAAPSADPGWATPYQTGYLPPSSEEQVMQAWAVHNIPSVAEPGPAWWRRVLVALGVAAVIAALGFPLGSLWSHLAPWLPVQISGGAAYYADPEGEQLAAQEGWFILLTIGAGIVLAILVWLLLRRFRGAWMVAGLAVGSLVAGWLTWRFGHTIGRAHALDEIRHGKDGTTVQFPVNLRIKNSGNIEFWHHLPYIGGDVVYMAIAAVITYLVFVGFSSTASLGVDRRRATPAPSDPVPAA